MSWPPSWPMYVPINTASAARATIVLAASRPRRLLELGLVDLPDAAGAAQESQCHRAADSQEVMRPNLRHAGSRARLAGVAMSGAAEAGLGKWPITPADIIGRDDAGCVAARAVDVQLQAVPTDVAYRLEWKLAEHGADRSAAARPKSLCQQ
jgi:hypothetical protein